MRKLKPLQDRILVKRLEEKEVKKGGIIIPDSAKEKPQEAEVIALAPGKITDDGKRQPLEVKVGDNDPVREVFRSEVKLGDEEFPDHARRRTSSAFCSNSDAQPFSDHRAVDGPMGKEETACQRSN